MIATWRVVDYGESRLSATSVVNAIVGYKLESVKNKVAAPLGIEPRLVESESTALPLCYGAIS